MTVLEPIRKRYSCREYQEKAIEQEKLDQIFEAARLAPSAKNIQDWRFVVVTDEEKKCELAKAANNQKFLEKAGAIIIACSNSDYVMTCGQPVGPINVAIALDHISLQAAQLGLATCWIGLFFPEKVRTIAAIPDNIVVIELMALGYPANGRRQTEREPLENIVCYEKWQF